MHTGVTVRKCLIWVKIDDFVSHVTFKFDRWPWKTIGHLFYATSSFEHHFVAISKFKLELQSRNAQFGSKLGFFEPCDLEIWRMNLKKIGHLFKATSSSVHYFIIICKFKLELQSGNGQVGCWPLWPWPLTSDLDLLHGRHFCHW